jgi:membrane protease YdiL (CAAX protease family)
MDEESSSLPPTPPVAFQHANKTMGDRTVALIEVLLCSDYPTQFALGATFATLGFEPHTADGRLNITYVVALSLTDAAVLVALIFLFLRSHGERPREVFLGTAPVVPEIRAGLSLTFAAYGVALAVLGIIRAVAPWLRTVPENPLQQLMQTPADAALFALVVVVAGGVREELQRAFLLRRFEQSLGGRHVGVVVGSLGFGIGHVVQGADAVITTTVLGLFWAVIYLRRRSVAAPMVSHAGFDLLQIAQFLTFGR